MGRGIEIWGNFVGVKNYVRIMTTLVALEGVFLERASFGKLKFLEKSRSYHCTNEKRLRIFAEYEKNFRSNN